MNDELETARTARAFGRYRVLQVLGKGAMGTVYLAEDPVIDRRVAVKVLEPEKGVSDSELEERQSRFEREFKAAGSLTHPNLVTIHDVGREHGASFIAMEYIEGESLRTILNREIKISPERAIRLLRQIAGALDFAHGRGIIHRDVKPANILLTESGDAKMTDFGVAKVNSVELTRTGIILGTPAYMSPEQVTDQNLTPASDQFSLAVMAYQMLAGRRPFGGENATKTLYQIAYHEMTPPSQVNRELPVGSDGVLGRALSKKAADRYPNCRAFVEALAQALEQGGSVSSSAMAGQVDLATRRMQQVKMPSPDLAGFEMNLPALEVDRSPAEALADSTSGSDGGTYSGPPPMSKAPSPAAQAGDSGTANEELLKPIPLGGAAKKEEEEIPQLREGGPGGDLLGSSDPWKESGLELLPIAEEVGTTVDEVYGAVVKDKRYRAWQAIGLAIAVVVACALWILWAIPT